MNTLPNDLARCNGVGFYTDDGSDALPPLDPSREIDWREGCEYCLRRTAARPDRPNMMSPPPIIAFECQFLIEP